MNLMDFQLFVNQELYEKYYKYLFNLQEEIDIDILDDYNQDELN